VFVMMTLFTKDGTPKLVPACTYPLTGLACVSRIYTEQAILSITPGAVVVAETFGVTVTDIASRLDVDVLPLES